MPSATRTPSWPGTAPTVRPSSQRDVGGDQRARGLRRLDDHRHRAERRHDPVAVREVDAARRVCPAGARRSPRRARRSARRAAVARRVGDVGPAGEDRDRVPPPASAPRCAAASIPRAMPLTTATPASGEVARQRLGDPQPVGARPAGADDRHRRRSARGPPSAPGRRRPYSGRALAAVEVAKRGRVGRVGGRDPPAPARSRRPLAARSRRRSDSASSTCSTRTASRPSRSAIVRARRSTRSRPRPLSPPRARAAASSALDLGVDRRSRRPRARAFAAPGAESRPLALARGQDPVADRGRALAPARRTRSGRGCSTASEMSIRSASAPLSFAS